MKRFFAIFICIATALIFVACTNNSETKSSKTETTQIFAQNSGDKKSFASIEDYINAEETQKAIDSMKKSYECMYDFDCYAEDNKFVYEYKYLETVGDEALPQIKKAFERKVWRNEIDRKAVDGAACRQCKGRKSDCGIKVL